MTLLRSSTPLVSVIIPVYNGERYLSRAIESVIAQEYRPIEIIVVDDGSTDQSARVIRRYQECIYLFQQNQGHASARNLGALKAQGELIAFLDADDVWLPSKLLFQVRYLIEHPDIGYVITHMRPMLEDGVNWPSSLNRAYYTKNPPCYLPSALLVRREVFLGVGLFDTRYRHASDSDWFLRAKDAGVKMAILPEVLVEKHIHSSNLSHETSVTFETMMAVRASIWRKENR
jgi:glycosyltransferase involved in cell wall biosynthesis